MVYIIIGTIRVNSIQSGGAFIVGERVICLPTSEMAVRAGPGSLNSGDGHTLWARAPADSARTSTFPRLKQRGEG